MSDMLEAVYLIPKSSPSLSSSFLPLVLRPWVGLDFLVEITFGLRLRDSNVFYEMGSAAPRPSSNLDDQFYYGSSPSTCPAPETLPIATLPPA